jgi:hypothetical protein
MENHPLVNKVLCRCSTKYLRNTHAEGTVAKAVRIQTARQEKDRMDTRWSSHLTPHPGLADKV